MADLVEPEVLRRGVPAQVHAAAVAAAAHSQHLKLGHFVRYL